MGMPEQMMAPGGDEFWLKLIVAITGLLSALGGVLGLWIRKRRRRKKKIGGGHNVP